MKIREKNKFAILGEGFSVSPCSRAGVMVSLARFYLLKMKRKYIKKERESAFEVWIEKKGSWHLVGVLPEKSAFKRAVSVLHLIDGFQFRIRKTNYTILRQSENYYRWEFWPTLKVLKSYRTKGMEKRKRLIKLPINFYQTSTN